MSGWGGDPWLPPGEARDPLRPPPGGPGGYAEPGWAPYGASPERSGSPRRRLALALGIASIALGVVALLAFVVGLLTFFAGGFLLWFLTKPLGIGAMVLAAASLVVAATARDSGWGSRFGAMVPGALTLLVTLPGLVGRGASEDDSARHYVETRLAQGDGPAEVVDIAASSIRFQEPAGVCLLLAERARGKGCASDPNLVHLEVRGTNEVTVLSESGGRALVRWTETFRYDSPQRIRLVREAAGWRLLDLPGLRDDCVERARDPFSCPVRRYGT